jgi:hypothetical protein
MTTLSDQLLLMRQSLDATEKELKALEAGRKASAPRARKSLQSLKQSSHQLRKQITESVKSMPTKKRTKKEEVNVLDAKMSQVEEPEPEEAVKNPEVKKKVRTKRAPKKD